MANTQLDPAIALVGAITSPWGLLRNATITFVRVVSTREDPDTGNQIPDDTETLEVGAYFKKAKFVLPSATGVPVGSYPVMGVPVGSLPVEGYTVGVLPDWAKESNYSGSLNCNYYGVGQGILTLTPKGYVVKDQVEKAGKGSQIHGYFTMQGAS